MFSTKHINEAFLDFENRLKQHDWYYEYSDDPRVYRSGNIEKGEIDSLYRRLKFQDEQKTEELYNKYCPFNK